MYTGADKLPYIEHEVREACKDSSQVEYNKLQSMGSDILLVDKRKREEGVISDNS